MMKKVLSLLVSACMFLVLAGCGGAAGDKGASDPKAPNENGSNSEKTVYTVTIAHALSEDSSLHVGSLKFKELLEESGRFQVNILPNAQMGSDRETMEALQNGNVTFFPTTTSATVTFVPSAVIFDMPFVYKDADDARRILKDENFCEVIQKEYETYGFHNMGFSDMGFRTLTTNKKVQTPDDLKGQVIRTMENPYHMEIWRSLGANPTPIAFNELYTALQQGTADGQENPIEIIHSSKFYEQQKFLIHTNHILHCIVWMCNNDFYQNLDAEAKQILDDAAAVVIPIANAYSDENIARYLQTIQDYGTEVLDIPEENRALFAEKAESTYRMIEEAAGEEVYNAFIAATQK